MSSAALLAGLFALAWLAALDLSVILIFKVVGRRDLLAYFPSRRRWWQKPAEYLSLGVFAALVHFNPL